MGSLAHLITRKWVAGLLALVAIVGAGAVIGLVGQAESPATGTAALPNGTDSRAAAELRDQLPEDEGSAAVVLYSSEDPLTADQLALVQERARTLPGATGAPPVVRLSDRRRRRFARTRAKILTRQRGLRPNHSLPRAERRSCSTMDSAPVSEAGDVGSIPAGSTSDFACWRLP